MKSMPRRWCAGVLGVLLAAGSASGQSSQPAGGELFRPPVPLTGRLSYSFHHPVAVDWNGDRVYDLLVGHHTEGWARALVYLNIGTNSQPQFDDQPAQFLQVKGQAWAVFCGCRLTGSSLLQIVDWNQDGKFDILVNGSIGDVELLLNTSSDRHSPAFDEVVKLPIYWRGKSRYAMFGYWDDDEVMDYGLTSARLANKGFRGFRIWKGLRNDGQMAFSEEPVYASPEFADDALYIGGRTAVAWDWRGDGYEPGKVEFIAAGPELNKEKEILLMEFDPADEQQPIKKLASIMPVPTEPTRLFAVALSACDFNRDGCMDLLLGYGGKYQQIDIMYGKVANAYSLPKPSDNSQSGHASPGAGTSDQ